MGMNLHKDVDIISVHDYERKAVVDGVNVWEYLAYYEYWVSSGPIVDPQSPKENQGKYAYWVRIYERGTGKLLKRLDGIADTWKAGRGAAQKVIKKEMEAYRRKDK